MPCIEVGDSVVAKVIYDGYYKKSIVRYRHSTLYNVHCLYPIYIYSIVYCTICTVHPSVQGREALELAIKTIEGREDWGGQVVYGDTDSVFVLLKGKSKVR